MVERVERHGLRVDATLAAFVEGQAIPGSGVTAAAFWGALAATLGELAPVNAALLARRAELQAQIDAWYRAGGSRDGAAQRAFLARIGYLVPEGPDFAVETTGIDPEIATIAGPQLVVPITNARYALNAANARWGSLYDALYGTDALGAPPAGPGYDPARGAQAIAWGRAFLDDAVPLAAGSHADVTAYRIEDGRLLPALRNPAQLVGWAGDPAAPTAIVLRNNGLHIILDIDRATPVGAQDKAGIADIRLESALTAIMDCEDSVACVDGADKTLAYANWLGLMRGDLVERVAKGGRVFDRRLAGDLRFDGPAGPVTLRGRALMLVRNVGHLMTTPAVLMPGGAEAPEGILDAFVTVLCAMHDLRRPGGPRNAPSGSVYVVKPKMHGPEEVAFAVTLFDRVEDALGLPRNTVKLGIMDEERRTSANLRECLRAARHRVAFINTGFLDRTGDEIHTAMQAGPVLGKGAMKGAAWLAAYEARNVEIGLSVGLKGRGQIGKGMWAMPDRMADMLAQKIAHPQAGANTAWVPSPTAATLHATHYHRVNVAAVQDGIRARLAAEGMPDRLDALLTPPLASSLAPETVREELENAAQGILGYVVRWVDQGVGCSKVPDIHDVGLMEDRATCRISAQLLANWLAHGVVTRAEVEATLARMAAVVDRQNAGDPAYRPMAPRLDGPAFRAAAALVFEGAAQPSGYTEPLLHRYRAEAKRAALPLARSA
jgi:malate synthase